MCRQIFCCDLIQCRRTRFNFMHPMLVYLVRDCILVWQLVWLRVYQWLSSSIHAFFCLLEWVGPHVITADVLLLIHYVWQNPSLGERWYLVTRAKLAGETYICTITYLFIYIGITPMCTCCPGNHGANLLLMRGIDWVCSYVSHPGLARAASV